MPIQMPNKNPKKPTNWSKVSKQLSFWVFVILVPVAIIQFSGKGSDAAPEISYSQYDAELQKNNVDKVTVQAGRMVTGNFKQKINVKGRQVQKFRTLLPTENSSDEITRLRDHGVQIQAEDARPSLTTILISLFPYLLIFGIWFFLFRSMQAGGAKAFSFGKSKAKLLTGDTPKVTFDDVAGADEAKVELQEIIELLKDPQKFTKLGGRLPKGALLVGPPGTGKTLLARAVAGEAGRPFFSMSGSDFVEMFVGVGASRVRDLFEQGKAHAPCIIFIDEIDAVGRHRGAGLGGGHDEREQTLNQLLVEMDGFESNDGVILLAATNRPDVLDPALLRPGRFDRQIVVDLPDLRGREAILKVHTRKIPLADDVDLSILGRGTPGFSGAEISNMVNEAALNAARNNRKAVLMYDFELAKDKVLMGAERKSLLLSEEEKKNTAYHEAGHALVAAKLPYSDPLHKVTIIPRGMALGVTMQLPIDDRHNYYKNYLETSIAILMGGRLAEEMFLDSMSTGAGNDIERATELARKMVCEWGMSDLGPLTFGKKEEQIFLGREIAQHRDYSEATAVKIDAEVQKLVKRGYDSAKDLLQANREVLVRIAMALIEREVLDATQIKMIIDGQELPKIVPPVKPDDGVQQVIKPDLQPGRAKGGERPAPA